MGDPFGRAIRDHYDGERVKPLLQRDGEAVLEHPIERFYFSEATGESSELQWIERYVSPRLLDVGAGTGTHAGYFEQQFAASSGGAKPPVTAIEVSERLISVMDDRGVSDARQGDMFALREQFDRDEFQSVLIRGTQFGLAGSMAGVRSLLADLATITDQEATAVIDCYDPTVAATTELLGYREDPRPGLAHRVMQFEYEGESGEILLFVLFSPDRLREATIGTGWTVVETRTDDEGGHYLAALKKTA